MRPHFYRQRKNNRRRIQGSLLGKRTQGQTSTQKEGEKRESSKEQGKKKTLNTSKTKNLRRDRDDRFTLGKQQNDIRSSFE